MQTIKTLHFTLAVYMTGDPGAKRLALCLPGYCDTKDYPDMRTHADLLGKRGYCAVAFDPPGTWGSAGDITEYTTTNYLQAIDELIAHFGHRPTLLVGKSMGGRMAQLAAQNPAVIGFVSVVGAAGSPMPTNLTAQAWPAHPRRTPHRDLPQDPSRFRDFSIPYSFVKDAAQYDAFDALGALTMPKLYNIAGKDDPLVRPERLRLAYDAAAAPKKFVVLPMDHDYRRDPKKLALVNDTIALFLDQYQL